MSSRARRQRLSAATSVQPVPNATWLFTSTEKLKLWQLLEVEQETGIELTESMAMWPGAAVSGWYFSHPDAKYFGTGKIGEDQVESLAQRKGMDKETLERWLQSVLFYG